MSLREMREAEEDEAVMREMESKMEDSTAKLIAVIKSSDLDVSFIEVVIDGLWDWVKEEL